MVNFVRLYLNSLIITIPFTHACLYRWCFNSSSDASANCCSVDNDCCSGDCNYDGRDAGAGYSCDAGYGGDSSHGGGDAGGCDSSGDWSFDIHK